MGGDVGREEVEFGGLEDAAGIHISRTNISKESDRGWRAGVWGLGRIGGDTNENMSRDGSCCR